MAPCFACGSELKLLEGRRAVCTLKSCPGGGLFYKCGYCGQFSFAVSPDKMFCYNPDCRMYKMKRSACPQCNKISVVERKEKRACVNRKCPSNAERIDQCFFCGNRSFLAGKDLDFCTKGDCKHLLDEMKECRFCKKKAYNTLSSRCENPGCEMYNIEVVQCPVCQERALVTDQSHPNFEKCLNPECSSAVAAPGSGPSPEMTLSMDIGDLKDLGGGLATALKDEAPSGSEQAPAEEPLPAAMQKTVIEEPPPGFEPAAPAATQDDQERTLLDEMGPRSQMHVDGTLADVDLTRSAGAVPTDEGAVPAAAEEAVPSEEIGGDELDRFRELGSAAAETTATRSSLIEAFEFVRECILGTGQDSFPMCLVIGVSGAGKTTYLTMLGDVLSQRGSKYHFPYKNLGVKRLMVPEILAERAKQGFPTFAAEKIPMLKARVRDLVFDYSSGFYGKSLGRMMWPESTAPEEEGGDIWTYFLVADIQRYTRTLAKIVTLETSGEDYEAVIKTIVEYDPKSAVSNPLQKVLHELMNHAEGFIVLLSPDSERNDNLFANFFMVLRDALEPRAMNVVASEIRERIMAMETAGEDVGGAGFRDKINSIRAGAQRKKRKEEEREERRRETLGRLRRVAQMFKSGSRLRDVERSKEGPFLTKMSEMASQLFPEALKRAQEMFEKEGLDKKGAMERYYLSLLQQMIKRVETVVDKLEEEEKLDKPKSEGAATIRDLPEEVFERIMWDIRRKYKLRDEFSVGPDVRLVEDLEATRFKGLKHIAVVVTKADMYPIIYPPEEYPGRKLQRTNIFLREVEDYLRLCGGEVRYYNTSATGYSMLRDTRHYPSKENTLTPINVIEPVFEMLAEYL